MKKKGWMITVKKEYVDAFMRGEKTMELRISVPKDLYPMDELFICEEGSCGKVVMKMTVISVVKEESFYMWVFFHNMIKMDLFDYFRYTAGHEYVYGVKVRDVVKLPEGLTTHDFSVESAPKWFRDAFPKKRAIELMEKGGIR